MSNLPLERKQRLREQINDYSDLNKYKWEQYPKPMVKNLYIETYGHEEREIPNELTSETSLINRLGYLKFKLLFIRLFPYHSAISHS